MQSIKSSFEYLGDSQETTQSNNNQGEDFLDQFFFLMLPNHPFDFEFTHVIQFL